MNAPRPPPSSPDQLAVALVGVGAWGERLLRGILQEPTLELRWLCDRDAARLTSVAEDLGVAATTRWQDLLEAPDVRAILVAVDPAANGHLALDALRAGKHVLVEKPFATDLCIGRSIAREAEQRGLVAGVGHILRYHPAFRVVDRLLASGELGRPWGLVAERLGPHRRRSLSPWWVLAPHDLSLVAAWLGQADLDVRVRGQQVEAQLHMEGGGMGRLLLGQLEERRRQMVLLAGKAVVQVNEAAGSVRLHRYGSTKAVEVRERLMRLGGAPHSRAQAALETLLADLPFHDVLVEKGDALGDELAAFSAAVRGGGELLTSAAASLPVLEMLLRGQRSQELAGRLRSDSVAREDSLAALSFESHGVS